ncbi:four-carbon acid sugar kinase family protein [Rhodococcus sp. IEGM 1354]|uniref:3-oxo-tetronate kinase n=1 Tax=Rhodococcus sp. IEGM 1354 TaxID=3047088 RepID=UPI0024B6FEC6|nr:3-oxo-tetronate kinase [Rhodococcus sp. IEGM 1354]MDI9933785.1 four-carbon acid sugar kinase family protein [Rhodococcus sp. IEGM 1354]
MTHIAVIADDYTGGTDAAAALRRSGLRVVMLFGVPAPGSTLQECDAVVVGIKFRSIASAEACEYVERTVAWLRENGVTRYFYKYCSTFDSTPAGNIGPVCDLLSTLTGARYTIVCPATPLHLRTTYLGHLFVGDKLLSDSPMRTHPLTPMTDSNLARWLSLQTESLVGSLPLDVVRAGHEAVTERVNGLVGQGIRHIVTDAIDNSDLDSIAAGHDEALLTGGAGLVEAVGLNLRASLPAAEQPTSGPGTPDASSGTLILAGSCSEATLEQVRRAELSMPALRLDPGDISDADALVDTAVAWNEAQTTTRPRLIYTSADAEERRRSATAMGPDTPQILEQVLARIASRAVEAGTRRIIVAGGETSGAVVAELGVQQVLVGDEAAPGVPWCTTVSSDPISLLLKSGNFGGPDFITETASA